VKNADRWTATIERWPAALLAMDPKDRVIRTRDIRTEIACGTLRALESYIREQQATVRKATLEPPGEVVLYGYEKVIDLPKPVPGMIGTGE
jgi:hypothetical protein